MRSLRCNGFTEFQRSHTAFFHAWLSGEKELLKNSLLILTLWKRGKSSVKELRHMLLSAYYADSAYKLNLGRSPNMIFIRVCVRARRRRVSSRGESARPVCLCQWNEKNNQWFLGFSSNFLIVRLSQASGHQVYKSFWTFQSLLYVFTWDLSIWNWLYRFNRLAAWSTTKAGPSPARLFLYLASLMTFHKLLNGLHLARKTMELDRQFSWSVDFVAECL